MKYILLSLFCAASIMAYCYAGDEPGKNAATNANDIQKIMEQSIAGSKKNIQLNEFIANIESKIKPLKLESVDGEVSLGYGQYYLGSSKFPLIRISVATEDIASEINKNDKLKIVTSMYIQTGSKDSLGNIVWRKTSPVWKEGKLVPK